MSFLQRNSRIGFVVFIALVGAVLLGLTSTSHATANGPVSKLQVTPVPPRPTALPPFATDTPVPTAVPTLAPTSVATSVATSAPTSVPSSGGGSTNTNSGQAVVSGGSNCDYWTVTIPEGAVPVDSVTFCTDFNASLAPAAPGQSVRLNRTISFSVKKGSAWVTSFSKALTFCYTLQASDTAANNDANRIQIVQAQYGGAWWFPVKAAGSATKACALVTSMPGNIFEVVVGPASGNYVVKAGDSLIKIARTFNTTADSIRSLNKLKTDVLQIGQVLLIQGSISTGTSITPAVSGSTYIVKPGDNLSRIARNLGTTVDALIAKNNLKTTVLQPGQVLIVP